MEDTQSAQDALVTAQDHLARGARSIGPRHPVRFIVISCAAATAFGASFDIPTTWHNIGALVRFPLPFLIVLAWTIYARNSWRARPRAQGYSRYTIAVLILIHILDSLAATALGLSLQHAHVPVPFTLAGLAYSIVFTALILARVRWANARYLDRVTRGQW